MTKKQRIWRLMYWKGSLLLMMKYFEKSENWEDYLLAAMIYHNYEALLEAECKSKKK